MSKISVCIATFNGEKYISSQLDSILNQVVPVHEIIISDDMSTDNTIEIIKNCNNPIIKIFINKERLGVAKNFENAIKHANGDFIFLCDQDDIWLKNKTQTFNTTC